MSASDAPYVGLDYFAEQDAELFFGREGERKRIIGNLRASRLTLLCAESGVGKSSLLRAGVSARLRRQAARDVARRGTARYVPVVFSAWGGDATTDLIVALEAATRPLLGDGAGLDVRRDTLEHALEDVARTIEATPLLILDQFEEHFLYEPNDGEAFDDDLARCVRRADLRANFLISVREDAYALIGQRFKASIPNVYGNYLHLDFLEETAARDAVVEPVRAFNARLPAGAAPFEIEPALAEAVIEQVRRGRVAVGDRGAAHLRETGPARVETAYLQLVMKRLWDEEVAAESQTLRLDTLQRLGGADTIVRSHLDDVMGALTDDERDAAAAAFRFLVTSGGRKIALTSGELTEFSDAPAAPLEAALEHLEDARILRRIPSTDPDGVARREIYHDVLAPAMIDWRRRHNERRLRAARQRARRLEIRNRRLAAAVVALVAVLVGVALYQWNPTPVQRLELSTVDARFAVRGSRPPDPRLVVVAVDDRTLEQLADRDGLLPRAAYATMLHRLRRDRPAVIALDVIFSERRRPASGDEALLAAMRAASERLVLAYKTPVAGRRSDGTLTMRADLMGRPDAVAQTGVKTGFAGLPEDVDGLHRRADSHVEFVRARSGAELASAAVPAATFAFAAAYMAHRNSSNSGPLEFDAAASRRASDEQSKRTTWIDYHGPPATVRRVSALRLLDGHVPARWFRNRRVVIGVTARGSPDVQSTPLDRESRMPGVEVQANAIETMLRGSPLRDVGQEVDIVAVVVLGCIPPLAALRRSRRFAVAAIVATAVVFVGVVQLAFLAGWIVAAAVPLGALAVAASGVAALAASRAVRRRRAAARGAGAAIA